MSTALLSKAPRRGPFDAVNIVPGPGAYTDPRVMVAKLPGFVPFSTSGRRNNLISESKRNLPAPGSYELELDLLSSAVAAAGSSFNSKVGRFNPKDSIRDGPGPSAYILPSTLNAQLHPGKKTLRSQTASAEMLQKLKEMSNVAIVPAIPRREQSHGYEPTENGRLVLQEPAFVPIPTTDPDLRFIAGKQNTKSVVFSNSPRQPVSEDPLRKSFAPGPGTYNHPSIFEAPTGGSGSSNYKHDYVVRLNEVKTRQTSAFESKTLRDSIGDEIKRRFAPGPQEYDVPSGMKVETRPVKNQFFSSSVQRFTNPVLQANRIYTSPGDYNPLTSDFDKLQLKVMKQKKMASRSLWAQQVAFEGTERRFNEVNSGIPKDWIGNRAPAPGAYDPNNNFGVEFSKPTAVPQTFGSKDTRFRQPRTWKTDALEKPRQGVAESSLLASSLDIPQPLPQSSPAKMARFMAEKDKDLSMLRGNILRGATAPFSNNPGSSVASASMNLGVTFPKSKGRFRDPDDMGPPPNAYHCEQKWVKGAVSMTPVVVQSRKKAEKSLPGPGEYVSAQHSIANTINVEFKKSRKDVMVSTAMRDPVVPRHMLEGPGPGAHNTAGGMLRPSYNIYLTGKAT